jgi:hypothetical protein
MKSLMSFGLVMSTIFGAASGCGDNKSDVGDTCGPGTKDNGANECIGIDAGTHADSHVGVPIDAPPDAFVPHNLVPNPGGETGDATGWTNNGGGATVTASTALTHTGADSLLTTARSGTWNGPAVSLTVIPGHTYAASIFARLVNGGTETFSVSIRHTCSEDNVQHFNTANERITVNALDNNVWVNPTSTFTVVSSGCTISNFLVYVETTTNAEDFYVDDISVIDVTP